MNTRRNTGFSYTVYDNRSLMPAEDQLLLKKAAEATETAYAPYSKFKVGAAALLSNGAVITGTNQENASFPVGICAERVLLSAANAIHPGTSILKIAISYRSSNKPDDEPVFPCGICRQSLLEQEVRQQSPVSLILAGATGEVFIIERSSDLIPFGFTNQNLA